MSFKGDTRRSWCRRRPTCWIWRVTWCSIRCARGWFARPGDWPWSSYRATTGEEAAPEWLESRPILAAFAETEAEAVERYARFVAEGTPQPSPWEQLKHQVFLGSDAFVESMRRKVPKGRDLREIPQAKARIAKPLAHYARKHPDRDRAIAAAYASGGYTMQEIGDYFGLHYSPGQSHQIITTYF